MNKITILLSALWVFASLFTGCSKWTDIAAISVQELNPDSTTLGPNYQRYLANLRSYKQTGHAQAIGMFDAVRWKLDQANQNTFLFNLPDSLDMVCFINQDVEPTAAQIVDMNNTRRNKGTKMIKLFDFKQMNDRLTNSLPISASEEQVETAINQYVDSTLRSYASVKYDGLYIRYEDLHCFNCTSLFSNIGRVVPVMNRLAEAAANQTVLFQFQGSDAMLLPAETAARIDYFVLNAFDTDAASYFRYDAYLNLFSAINGFTAEKLLLTVSYQIDRWKTGGDAFPNNDGAFIGTAQAFSKWNVTDGRKGGLAFYYVELDYLNNPPFVYTRSAIQQLNPAIK